MNSFVIIERLLWGAWSGAMVGICACLLCKVKSVHPLVKTWAVRIAFVKALLALVVVGNVSVLYRLPWLTQEVQWLLVTAWALGVAVVVTYAAKGYWSAHQLQHGSAPMKELSDQIGIPVRACSSLPEPCIVGVIRPTILVPAGSDVDPMVLEHELAHVRHLDPAFGFIAWIIQTIFWFVPGSSRLIAEHGFAQEIWADLSARKRLAVAPSKQARALLTATENGSSPTLSSCLGFRGDAAEVARRIEAMFVGGYSKVWGALGFALPILVALPQILDKEPHPVLFSPDSRAVSPSRVPVIAEPVSPSRTFDRKAS